MKVIKARPLVGKGVVRGEALVCSEPICFLGGVDVKTGNVTEKGHPLYGLCIKDKMLIFTEGKGSTGGSYLIYDTVCNGNGPKCMLNLRIEQITAIGCIMGKVPVMDQPEEDITRIIQSGDMVEADFSAGTITILDS